MCKEQPPICAPWQGNRTIIVTTRLSLFLALLLTATSGAIADQLDQKDLDKLKAMTFAAYKTNYTGVFIYQYGNHVETSRITHISDRDGEHGRLEGLDGVNREIIHNNNQVWSYLNGHQVSVEERRGRRSFPALLPEQISVLNESYQIKKAEAERVAGLPTDVFVFQPKDKSRYSHKLWAHNDSGLLLKAAVLDDRGRIIEQYTFTHLTIGGNIDRKWITPNKPNNSSVNYHTHHPYSAPTPKTEQAVHNSGWQIGLLPPGFKKTMEVRRPLHGNKTPVTHLIFSDGLAGVSVFIEDMTGETKVITGLSSQGLLNIYRKIRGSNLVTVVGEVPPRTVMQIADSARYLGH